MKNILVLCTGNSCRSQMAHGFLAKMTLGKAQVYSAGVETHGVNPKAIACMKEIDIDIAHHSSNNITEYFGIDFDYVITVCDNAKERCPYFPSKAIRLHHNFPDPSKFIGTEEAMKEQFRIARNLIQAYCEKFVKKYF